MSKYSAKRRGTSGHRRLRSAFFDSSNSGAKSLNSKTSRSKIPSFIERQGSSNGNSQSSIGNGREVNSLRNFLKNLGDSYRLQKGSKTERQTTSRYKDNLKRKLMGASQSKTPREAGSVLRKRRNNLSFGTTGTQDKSSLFTKDTLKLKYRAFLPPSETK